MVEEERKEERLQWHPAFYAGLQIELKDEAGNLIFENEHQLGTMPKEIDVLIIKKEKGISIEKNIGRIFREHNVIEYKDPEDYLSIDDYYKVLGYAFFYKSDTPKVDSIKIEEITVSFFCSKFPRNLFRHLEGRQKYQIIHCDKGIYEVLGADFPVQIILATELEWDENKWLKSLSTQLERKKAEEITEEYNRNKKNPLYESVMDIVVKANKEKFQEVEGMCEALRELFKDELDKQLKIEVDKQLKIELDKQVEAECNAREKAVEKKINTLNLQLIELGRVEDIVKAAENKAYQLQLFEEFSL